MKAGVFQFAPEFGNKAANLNRIEAAAAVAAAGGRVVGLASIVDRSGGVAFPYPFRSLLQLRVATYAPEACPLCREGKLPAIKPGSREVPLDGTKGAGRS